MSLVVIHNISLPPEQFGGGYIEQFFCNQLCWDKHPYFETIRGVEVSAHFLVSREGNITQFVSTENRAWHAGKSSFDGEDDCNNYSIGIELEGADNTPYEQPQYCSTVELIKALKKSYPDIHNERITGHEHIAPGRKTDPGPAFDWKKLIEHLQGGS
ncbi:N-acetyl-anhydromuranmyl-L-alanine amidase [Marinibactrum halimedae]|uniref:1,6-anhydro-N-acetylmuramyl-L-alanine amidase AmpD n=1 Tax=Marinibactrum halimedae TaxID=1444977 RepID=A0AA37T8B9_9GAMM|nr:N-acetyl-anhydromuranmyl-L-alanine amidase [Marinibactrum halimedae]